MGIVRNGEEARMDGTIYVDGGKVDPNAAVTTLRVPPNPYFAPGPDGRRPIVERVPECRPQRLRLHTAGWFVEDETGRISGTDYQFCNEQTALALCRCAALDWLISRGWLVLSCDTRLHCVHIDISGKVEIWGDGGADVHENTAIACHRVADHIRLPH
jgi:hypothetical protein